MSKKLTSTKDKLKKFFNIDTEAKKHYPALTVLHPSTAGVQAFTVIRLHGSYDTSYNTLKKHTTVMMKAA